MPEPIDYTCIACGCKLRADEATYCTFCADGLEEHYSSKDAFCELIERPQVEEMNHKTKEF